MANMRRSPCGSRSSTRRSSARAAAPSRAIRSGPPRRPNYGLSGARPTVPGCSRRFSRRTDKSSCPVDAAGHDEPRGTSLRGAGQQRRDAPDGDAAVFAGGSRRLHLELLGAVALRRQILGRHLEVLGEDDGDGFRAAVGQRQVVDVVADRVGMALDQEHLVGIAPDHLIDRLGDIREQRDLVRSDLPRSELEGDRVQIDAPHAVAQRRTEADFVERVGALDRLDRRRFQRRKDSLPRSVFHFDDVFVPRDHDARRRQRHEDFHASGTSHAVVDQDELAAVPGPAHTAQQAAALVDVSDDLHVARTPHQCDDFARTALDANVLAGQAETRDFVMTDERAAVLADDHAVIRLFDHGALPVVLGALLPLLAQRFELLRPALITGSGRPRRAGLRLTRPRILRPDRNAGRRRALGILALAALRRARRLASRLLGRLRPSRRAGRLARLLRGSRLAGTGLRARSLAGLLRGSRLGGAAWLRSRRLAPLLLNWLALCTRRRGRLLGRARLTGLRPAGRRTAFLPFLLLGVLPLIASGALRRLSALGPGTLGLDLRLRAFGRSRLLLLAPLLPGLLRFGLCQQLGRRHRRRDLRREGAAAQRQRGDHDRARQQRAFVGNQVHVPASEIWVRPALATQSCSDCGNPCGTDSRAGVASRAHPRLTDKGPAIVARPRPLRGIARLSTSVPEPKRRDMSYQEIRYETRARIATITLDRPARLNAWTPNMGGEVRDATRRAADDDAVRVIVLTGAGRGFCAGADMATLSRLTEARGSSATSQAPPPFDPESRPDFQKRYSYFPAVPKPIIAPGSAIF